MDHHVAVAVAAAVDGGVGTTTGFIILIAPRPLGCFRPHLAVPSVLDIIVGSSG